MSQLSDTTAAMQIASPLGRQPMQPATSHSESYFSVGSSSPPDYGTACCPPSLPSSQFVLWTLQEHPKTGENTACNSPFLTS
ncbi:hypothetical protein Aduo_012287 [Ancylostoma duodenale]